MLGVQAPLLDSLHFPGPAPRSAETLRPWTSPWSRHWPVCPEALFPCQCVLVPSPPLQGVPPVTFSVWPARSSSPDPGSHPWPGPYRALTLSASSPAPFLCPSCKAGHLLVGSTGLPLLPHPTPRSTWGLGQLVPSQGANHWAGPAHMRTLGSCGG